MKKLIALILAIIMIASMSVVAFAAEETVGTAADASIKDESNANKTHDTKVEYKPTMGYEVIIPGDIVLEENESVDGEETTYYGKGEGPVAINKAKIPAGKSIYVVVGSANDDVKDDENYNWVLKANGGLKIDYNLSLTDLGSVTTLHSSTVQNKLAQDGIVLFYTSAGGFKKQTATMVFQTENIVQAGNFLDTLTFSVSVEDTRA